MAAEQSEAIVLRIFPWSETSLIGSLYTRDFGKISVLAKGARRPKSPFEAALDLLSLCRVVFIAKSGDSLDVLTEAKLQKRFRAGSKDLLRLYSGYYVAELLERLTDHHDKQPEIFELAVDTLDKLAQPELEVRAIVLRLEMQLLRMVGQLPSLQRCAHCGTEFPRGEWVIYGVLAGGILCDRCRSGGRQLLRIAEAAREVIERYADSDWRGIPLDSYIDSHRSAIRGVVVKTLTAMLDRKLNLHSYLEELGR